MVPAAGQADRMEVPRAGRSFVLELCARQVSAPGFSARFQHYAANAIHAGEDHGDR